MFGEIGVEMSLSGEKESMVIDREGERPDGVVGMR